MATGQMGSVVERIIAEGPVGCTVASKRMGVYRNGKGTHPSTIRRWCADGVRLPDGRVVKLEHYVVAGRTLTSHQAVVRFIEAQQPADGDEATGPGFRTAAERVAACDAAAKELELAGC